MTARPSATPGRSRSRSRRGRPDERRPGRARPRRRVVRRRALGVRHPVPVHAERFDLLEEQLAVVTGLWASPATSPSRARTTGSSTRPALPKPAQEKPPVIYRRRRREADAGAGGPICRRVQLAVRPFEDGLPSSTGCAGPARPPAATRRRCGYSSALVLCVGARRRGGAPPGGRRSAGRRDLRANELGGTPAEVVDKIGRYTESGPARSTCRCSTCPISTTSDSSPRRSCPRWPGASSSRRSGGGPRPTGRCGSRPARAGSTSPWTGRTARRRRPRPGRRSR